MIDHIVICKRSVWLKQVIELFSSWKISIHLIHQFWSDRRDVIHTYIYRSILISNTDFRLFDSKKTTKDEEKEIAPFNL